MLNATDAGGGMALPAIDQADANSRPHDWQCPVIMKTAPGCVAYTCAKCGAIAVLGGHEPFSQLHGWPAASSDRAAPLECVPHREAGGAKPFASLLHDAAVRPADGDGEALFAPPDEGPAGSVRPA